MLTQIVPIEVEILDTRIKISLSGSIDNQKVITDLLKILEENLDKFSSIQLDISDVEFINTFFINGLIRIKRQFTMPLFVVGVNSNIKELLDISNVSRIIAISN